MDDTIELGDMTIQVVRKEIKNVHLSVYPPAGRVRIAAPSRTSSETLRLFAISKLGWIKEQQAKLQEQERESPREYLERESHYVWGKRYLLKVREADEAPSVELEHSRLILQVRPGTDEDRRKSILAGWYREQIKLAAPPLIAKWEPLIGVAVDRFFVQHMKTRWGSCNPAAGAIRLNTELAKKPPECLEYIVVHEMIHLIEPTHNQHFVALMDRYMPKWQFLRDVLNRLPVRHESWGY